MSNNHYIKEGILEVFAGAMLTGKTEEMLLRLKKIMYLPGENIICYKPTIDTRNVGYIYSRRFDMKFDAIMIKPGNEYDILKTAKNFSVIGIDEGQFFSNSIIYVVQELLLMKKNVMVAGLDTAFNGEPFEPMSKLMSIADYVTKTHGVCTVPGCGGLGRRTQLLIDGAPAPFNLDLIRPEDNEHKVNNEKYELRCLEHHVVPGRPK